MGDKTENLIDEAIRKTEEYVNERLAQKGYVLLSEAWDVFREHLGITTSKQNEVLNYPDNLLPDNS